MIGVHEIFKSRATDCLLSSFEQTGQVLFGNVFRNNTLYVVRITCFSRANGKSTWRSSKTTFYSTHISESIVD